MAHAVELRPTAGLRSIACLGVTLAHMVHFAAWAAADKAALYTSWAEHRWIGLILHTAEPAMDTFMVLTGFMAAISLVPQLEKTADSGQTVARYYWKRVLRIIPSFYSALAIACAFILPQSADPALAPEQRRAFFGDSCVWDSAACPTVWRTFALLHNQQRAGGCFHTTWSLAVQMRFYLTFPLALLLLRPKAPGFRARVKRACMAAIAFVLSWRAAVFLRVRLWEHMPLPFFGPPDAPSAHILDICAAHGYFGHVPRLSPLAMGVLTALMASDAGTLQTLIRHSDRLLAGCTVLLAFSIFTLTIPRFGLEHDPSHFLAEFRPIFNGYVMVPGLMQPLLAATAILVVTVGSQGGNLSARAALFLSQPAFQRLADLSYDVFLLHPMVIYFLWSVLPPSTWFKPARPDLCLAVFCLVLALTLPVAWLHGRFWTAALKMLEACSRRAAAGPAPKQAEGRGRRAALLAAGKPCGMKYDGLKQRPSGFFPLHRGASKHDIKPSCAVAM